MTAFDRISEEYKEKSLVQQKAASKLFNLLKITDSYDIIDIACGPGHITKWLSRATQGRVTGIDISEGMITQARSLYPEIEFRQIAVEDMDYDCEFDIAFCNSAIQWFSDPDRAVRAIYSSLKPGGKMGIACPATSSWHPGFTGSFLRSLRKKRSNMSFPTGRIPGSISRQRMTTNKGYYDIDINDEYIAAFNNRVKDEIKRQSRDGRILVDFNRLYYSGQKKKNGI